MAPCTEVDRSLSYDVCLLLPTEDSELSQARTKARPAVPQLDTSTRTTESGRHNPDLAPVAAIERVRCVLHITLLCAAVPISLLYVLFRFCLHHVSSGSCRSASAIADESTDIDTPKVVLVTGGKMSKALHIARCLWRCGHKVVLVETEKYWCSGSRFSRSVWKFETVRCPRVDPEGYKHDLAALVVKHGVNFFVPVSSPVASTVDSEFSDELRCHSKTGNLSGYNDILAEAGRLCKPLHFTQELCALLDDKVSFGKWIANDLGLKAPETYRVESDDEARAYNVKVAHYAAEGRSLVLKNIQYDPIHRLDLFQLPCPAEDLDAYLARIRQDGNGIGPGSDAWQLQEFIAPSDNHSVAEYTALVVIRGGRVVTSTTSLSSASQLNYDHVEVPVISEWVRGFDSGLRSWVASRGGEEVDGICCFDFMVRTDLKTGQARAHVIECNPRVHSQMSVFASEFEQMELGRAMMMSACGAAQPAAPLQPLHGRVTFWFWNELLKCVPNNFVMRYGSEEPMSIRTRLANLLFTLPRRLYLEDDGDFAIDDCVPFIMRNHFQPVVLLLGTLRAGRQWKKIDFNIGKVVEVNGD
eukprot:CAMPEP_0194477082 /NCGR_PEP_ID=MMETSP0253-20130528/857_1 /TAXON_ID=2966 /ORGANISM="Noctiluca scintillans" /LENGTH=583 /DNA_ID=CAMNT_0039316005 /DNA_START=66 /DNA_END=1817 /DNA_ORIENTATION=+